MQSKHFIMQKKMSVFPVYVKMKERQGSNNRDEG